MYGGRGEVQCRGGGGGGGGWRLGRKWKTGRELVTKYSIYTRMIRFLKSILTELLCTS